MTFAHGNIIIKKLYILTLVWKTFFVVITQCKVYWRCAWKWRNLRGNEVTVWGSVGECGGSKPPFWKKIAYGKGAKKSKKKTNNSAFWATHTYIKLILFFLLFFSCTFPLAQLHLWVVFWVIFDGMKWLLKDQLSWIL